MAAEERGQADGASFKPWFSENQAQGKIDGHLAWRTIKNE
jgi:hypothetical protein